MLRVKFIFSVLFLFHCFRAEMSDFSVNSPLGVGLAALQINAPNSFQYPLQKGVLLIERGKDVKIEPQFQGRGNFQITPPLPTGLNLDPITGVISGKALFPTSLSDYTVQFGNSSQTFKLEVQWNRLFFCYTYMVSPDSYLDCEFISANDPNFSPTKWVKELTVDPSTPFSLEMHKESMNGFLLLNVPDPMMNFRLKKFNLSEETNLPLIPTAFLSNASYLKLQLSLDGKKGFVLNDLNPEILSLDMETGLSQTAYKPGASIYGYALESKTGNLLASVDDSFNTKFVYLDGKDFSKPPLFELVNSEFSGLKHYLFDSERKLVYITGSLSKVLSIDLESGTLRFFKTDFFPEYGEFFALNEETGDVYIGSNGTNSYLIKMDKDGNKLGQIELPHKVKALSFNKWTEVLFIGGEAKSSSACLLTALNGKDLNIQKTITLREDCSGFQGMQIFP
jgi:hypothetical protein